ncbi:MAG TPA: 2,3-bisphosphoglycerate-independent phosphoglycerate mutase [Acholeplasmataceae bacterium]|jgi:2,3-bisphosphoglycerate-independent phosphoglycerate mutase|nr:2,3-bisphosphoglycerate-independent phosphoglycerate mutase [Acholeplasmataceae bacterium]
MKRLVMLTILDGFGLSDNKDNNAIYAAKKPNLDYLFKEYPNNTLNASGEAVGLPEGQMGNSEVGHLNLGAGRIVYQSLTRVNIAVRENTLIKNEVIQKAIKHAKENKSKVHIMGLLSDGGVHSHIKHILYLVEKIVAAGVKEVVVHAYLDGRDTPPKSALTYLKELQETIDKVGNSKIGIVSGRYYAMDRDRNWDRVQPAYEALVYNKGAVKNVFKGIEESYVNGVTDEFVYPYIANLDSNINDGDSVIFANFRKDRAIEMSMALTNLSMTGIQNGKVFKDLFYASMMEYSENVKGEVILPDLVLENIYGEIIEKAGMTQLRIAETEKYAHVTFFFDGGEERTFKGADRILVPSPKEVPTYDLKPEMSAFEVCAKAEEAIASRKYDTIILNFANCDMVGHTTVFDATVKAVETVDTCVGRLYEAVKKVGGVMIVIADHGNAEKLVEDGKPFSAHTLNPVPFIITDKSYKVRSGGNLGDVAPTLLELLGIKKPVEMTGKTLIYKNKEEF